MRNKEKCNGFSLPMMSIDFVSMIFLSISYLVLWILIFLLAVTLAAWHYRVVVSYFESNYCQRHPNFPKVSFLK